MKSAVSKQLRHSFSTHLKRQFPPFKKVKNAVIGAVPGNSVFEVQVNDVAFIWIILAIHPRQNGYSIDVCWTKTRQFPPRGGSITSPYLLDGQDMHFFNIASFTEDNRDAGWLLDNPMTAKAIEMALTEEEANILELSDRIHAPACNSDEQLVKRLESSLTRVFEIIDTHLPTYIDWVTKNVV